MSKILIVSNKSELTDNIEKLLKEVGYDAYTADNENDAFAITSEISPDIALVNSNCEGINISKVCKKLKLQGETNDIQIILMISSDTSSEDVMVGADGYITKPFNDNILIATVNAHLRIKKLLDILYTNNSELARSLYQLNVLYNTSSQLAGTLDKKKLITIMNDGLEKSLSYSLCSTLVINDPENAVLIVNSTSPITERLEHALKLRAMVGYKSLFEDKKIPFDISINNISIKTYIKNSEDKAFDLDILNHDSLFSPVSISDKFFGTAEILRKNEFTGEDSTCFQTVVKQVSLPLESAILYEEITEKNIKLEKLEKLKSEFISIVSHELRTPLTAIKNALDIMLSGKTGTITGAMDNFLNMARRNVQRLSGIINDLLDLSKIEAGKMDYRFESMNIAEPLEFAKSTFEHMAQKKNIAISLKVEDNLPNIYADNNRFEQVMSNLISNAIKFTPENGSVEISAGIINAKNIDKSKFYGDELSGNTKKIEGDYIQVNVADCGIGIKEEDIPKVFDKFQQIESSLSREVGGTGLGLPIAKQLIDAHKGEIWIESEFGTGTTFSFILPVMNQNSTFYLELENGVQKAKYNRSNLSLICILEEIDKSSNNSKKSVINDIANGKINIIRKQDNSKLFVENKNSINKLRIALSETDSTGLDYVINRLEELLKSSNNEYTCSKVSIGYSVFPDDASEAQELISKAENNLKQMYIDDKLEVK